MNQLLTDATARALRYLHDLDARRVFPAPEALAGLDALDFPLPDAPTDPLEVLRLLDDAGSPGTVASAGRRYFGFVTGGALPAALAANWLAGAWDQPADMVAASPVGARLEAVAARWLLDVLRLPPESGVGLVTGATMANFCGLAAARHALLAELGWDVEARGLYGAPEIAVIVGDEVHVSLLKALSMLGLGRERVIRVPADEQGRLRAEALPEWTGPTIVCIQAGNVNSGAFDPAAEVCAAAEQARARGIPAWVHVDGAFGMWAAAAPGRAHLAAGFERADSWAVDAHKWLNVPYDSGAAICREERHLRAAMSYSASYLALGEGYEPGLYTPEMSRRLRGIEVWAALLSLGRSGLEELIERTCRHARRFADRLSTGGYEILNAVELNQVLVSFGDDAATRRAIAAVQQGGTCWCGGATWHGRAVMRISVSCWATTDDDVERSLEAILRLAAE
jgi:glutamate/tyrosine decarboxylase-like PLP-dependent enzyme